MAQGISNYSFAINSTYDPFTFQELLTPYVMYKDAFEKTETAYDDLTTKADKFKYLGQQLEGEDSKAAQIYKGYADELHKQADDLAKHGLNMSNRRGLTSLKQRYASEIGRLDLAQTAMDEEKKRRRDLYGKDSSLLYATDNLRLDDFLDESTPNLYSISGNELYTRGAAAGKAASSRVYSAGDVGSTLGGYYRDWVEKYGYDANSINAFRANVAAIPELQQSVDSILQERGVDTNLTGANLQRARQAVINGIIDGAVYQESHKPVRDEGVLSAAQKKSFALEQDRLNLSAASSGMVSDGKGNWNYDSTKDPAIAKVVAVAAAKGNKGGSNGNSSSYGARNKLGVLVGSKTGTIYRDTDDNNNTGFMITGSKPLEEISARALTSQEYTSLVDAYGNITNDAVRNAVGNGKLSDYEIFIIPSGSTEIDGSGFFSDDDLNEDVYMLIPRESKKNASNTTNSEDEEYSDDGGNDVPQQ